MGRDVSRVSEIVAIAEPIAAERGLEILDVELAGTGAAQIVRVLLDSPDDERRIGIEDCQVVSRRLGDGLDAYEVLKGRYMLEVSSPGVNKPLKRPEHFRRVVGRKVRVRTKQLGDPADRRTFIGRLDEAGDDGIAVTDETGTAARIAFADIEKANLEFEFETTKPPGAKKKR
jgi:ribosome maturation factor RimP